MNGNVIAIDGPSYVGKSTISKSLAELMGYTFINTGHMYRTIAKKCLDAKIAPENRSAVCELAGRTDIQFRTTSEGTLTFVDGEDWTAKLGAAEIVLFASKIAPIPELREQLTEMQRAYAQKETIVMEGRDIGSVVFPDARWKFFVTASVEIRAWRMYKLMTPEEKKSCSDYHVLIPKIEELDRSDMSRAIAPLKKADDAIVYDNSDSPSEKQDALILQYYLTHGEELMKNAKLLSSKLAVR